MVQLEDERDRYHEELEKIEESFEVERKMVERKEVDLLVELEDLRKELDNLKARQVLPNENPAK